MELVIRSVWAVALQTITFNIAYDNGHVVVMLIGVVGKKPSGVSTVGGAIVVSGNTVVLAGLRL